MHLRVAERMGSMPRSSDWRTRRELGLVLSLATLAPLTVCAFEAHSSSAVVGLLMLATLTVGTILLQWIKTEYALQPLSVSSQRGVNSALSMPRIPRMHLGERRRAVGARSAVSSRKAARS